MVYNSCNKRQIITWGAAALFALISLPGCDKSGGGSGWFLTGSPDLSTALKINSVQTGLPIDVSSDNGAINGTAYPVNVCETFIVVDSSESIERKGVWLRINASGADISYYDWEIVNWNSGGSYGALSQYHEVIDIDSNLGRYLVRSTNNVVRYECAAGTAISDKHRELIKVTAWTDGGHFVSAYFQIQVASNTRLFVVGDSISTRGNWPADLQRLANKHTFSQAIGGSRSPSMVYRAQGVEPAYPLEGVHSIEPGTLQLRWHRHVADRTQNELYRSMWAEYAKAVSEPDTIEVYKEETFIGYAERILKPFTTSYEDNLNRIYCDDHGLTNGDRVVFISNDPVWPSDLSVLDASATWKFSSAQLPASIVERRVYFAGNVESNSFEIMEFESDEDPIDLNGNAIGNVLIECGWQFDFEYSGGELDIAWHPRTKYDHLIWLLMVSANDIPGGRAEEVTIPNTLKLLNQMSQSNDRFILVCPPSGSYRAHGPGSLNWINYYDTYMPWVYSTYPDNHVDTMAVLGAMRTQAELNLLTNPALPELLWISGDPLVQSSWTASTEFFYGSVQVWVGPGYIPLQFRNQFDDTIHMNALGNQVLAGAVLELLDQEGW